jgi:hypothetical protein
VVANCAAAFFRPGSPVSGRDVQLGDLKEYAVGVRVSIQPTSTQSLSVREAGLNYQANYTLYVETHNAAPQAGDRVRITAAYFPGWAQALAGKGFSVSDVAPNPRGLVRCSLAEASL